MTFNFTALTPKQIAKVLNRGEGWEAVFLANLNAFRLILSSPQFGALAAEANLTLVGAATVLTATAPVVFGGAIGAGSTGGFTIVVAGASPTNTPTVILGWSSDLEPGLVVAFARVGEPDNVYVYLTNTTSGPITPATRTVRATVFQY